MDQSSFRSLLSTGNASASSSKPVTGRAAGILGGQTLKRGYGSGGSKKTTNFAPKNKDAEAEGSSGGKSKPAFVPRAAKKDNKYKDRAELRRTGEDDEYKPMQKMLEDFETRAKAEGEDEETIAERRAMLGGDASHSILVKGLDYALLAAKKAEIAAKEGDKLDDEFDEFLERDVQPTQPDEDSVPKKGKSRDEIMEALKASRKRLASLHGAGGGEDDRDSKRAKVEVEEKPQGLGSKFKSLAKKREEEEARRQKEAEGKKKKKKRKVKAVDGEDVGYPDASAVAGEVPVDGEVKPKKKKKKVEMEMPPHAAIATSASMQDISAVEISGHEVVPPPRHVEPQQPAQDSPAVNLPPSTSDIAAAPTPPAAASIPPSDSPSPSPAPAVDMEVDDDIFGDAGDYNPGLSDVSSDDDGEDEKDEKDGKEREAPATAKKGRGWFGDEEEEAPGKEVDPILATVLRAGKSSTSAAAETIDAAEPLSRSPSPDPILPGQSLRRLEPLASSSGPSARELLERAKYEEEQDKRRSKKAAWRAKQGLSKQDTGDDDDDEGYRKKDDDNDKHEKRRRTREMQQLQAHMTKKGMM